MPRNKRNKPVQAGSITPAMQAAIDADIAKRKATDNAATIEAEKPVATETQAKPETDGKQIRDIAAERLTAKQLHSAFEAQRLSVPVKTTAAFKPVAVSAHPIARKPSQRQAAAIAVCLAANGAKLADGATASRIFNFDNAELAIENGCLRDAISSGLISVSGDAGRETIKLRPNAAKAISGLLGSSLLKKAKLID